MSKRPLKFYEFGPFRLNVTERLLLRERDVVPLTPKVFDTLLVMVENSGYVLDKNELMQTLWPDSFVEESSLSQNISLLRRALGQAAGGAQYIETLPKRGYRFVVDVREVAECATEAVMNEHTATAIPVNEEDRKSSDSATVWIRAAFPVKTKRRFALKLSFAAASIVIMAVTAAIYFHARGEKTESFAPKSIAVLPFETVGKDAEADLLDLGVVDALILRLSRLDQTIVLPTSSVFKYADHKKDSFTIGKELGVEAVLDGTLQREGDSVRVSAQLIRISDGKTLWSEKFDEPYHGLFSLQDSVSGRLAEALISQMHQRTNQRNLSRPTQSAEAYQAYLMGVYFWNLRTKENVGKAINYLEQAVKIDPSFALAHAVLADSYYVCVENNWNTLPVREAYLKANIYAAKALDLDDGIAEAHTVKAGLLFKYRDYDAAEREFRRALELNPGYSVGHLRYGYFLFSGLKLDEALYQMKRAQQLDPVSPTANLALGYILFMSRDFDGAIKCYKKALEFQPGMTAAQINLGETYTQKRMFQEARAEFEKIKGAEPLTFAAEMTSLYGVSGSQGEALHMFSQLQKLNDRNQICPYQYAVIYTALNDKEKAFAWLEQISANRIGEAQVRFDPEFDILRKDPKFEEWLRRHQD